MIFKNNGDIIRKNTDGNFYWANDKIYHKVGNNLFGSDGSRTIHNGNITFKNQKTIRINGNYLFTSDGERYVLNGNILFGPHGEQWRGVSSMEEARNIVSMNM
ncbi:MAG: hypothetical protein IJK77_07855 [Lachnospiraceae bacterium]|nr:hypothetical protein [Lachnospiraceae bacterium]